MKLLKGRTRNLFDKDGANWKVGENTSYHYNDDMIPNNVMVTMSFKEKDPSVDISNCSFGFANDVDSKYSLSDFVWSIYDGVIGTNKTNKTSKNILCNQLFCYPRTAIQTLMQRYDIQIEIGSTATPYVPYKALIKSGGYLNKIDNVDTLNAILPSGLKAVDLGSLTWAKDAGANIFYTTQTFADAIAPSWTTHGEVVCGKYMCYPPSMYNGTQIGLALSDTKAVWVRDTDYSSASDFKQAMQGVILIYKTA